MSFVFAVILSSAFLGALLIQALFKTADLQRKMEKFLMSEQ